MRLARNTEWDSEGGQNGVLLKPAYNMPEVKELVNKGGEPVTKRDEEGWYIIDVPLDE